MAARDQEAVRGTAFRTSRADSIYMESIEHVSCRGRDYSLQPGVFYHLADEILLWNVRLHEGLCPSVSVLNEAEAEHGFVTMYGAFRGQSAKERLWESIREADFPEVPTRQNGFFLFESGQAVQTAREEWFPHDPRPVVEVRIVTGSVVHRADARWLDAVQADWNEASRRYWTGDMTDDPRVEIILKGLVYFPGWREHPFGQPLPRL